MYCYKELDASLFERKRNTVRVQPYKSTDKIKTRNKA